LKLIIRQRKNSLFYATPHSAYVASLLTSLIATCVQAGVNAMDYLGAGLMKTLQFQAILLYLTRSHFCSL
jgi:hypothetical protein